MKLRHLRNWAVLLAAWAAIAYAANPAYVGTDNGLYKSTDAGATWTNVDIPLNNPLLSGSVNVLSLSMDPQDPSKIYFIGIAGAWAFFASPDAGQTWSATPFIGLVPDHVGVDFAGQVIYVTAGASAGSDDLLYKSTDRGETWTRLMVPNSTFVPASQNPLGSPVGSFVPDPTVSGTIYALTNGDVFFKSVDFGDTWTLISSLFTLTSGDIVPQTTSRGMFVDPRNPLTWYGGADHNFNPSSCPLTNGGLCGLFKSTDGGATFTGLSIPSDYVNSVSFGTSGTVYAAADVAGLGATVMKTTDGGSTWKPLKNGLFATLTGQIKVDPTDGATIFVYDGSNLFYASTDAGAHFTPSLIPPAGCCRPDVNDVLIAASVTQPHPAPAVNDFGVVNNASFAVGSNPVAPGAIAAVFGTNLNDGSTVLFSTFGPDGKLVTTLGGTEVKINANLVPVFYSTPSQLGVQIPTDLTASTATIEVTAAGQTSAPKTIFVDTLSPGIFSVNQSGRGQGAILIANTNTLAAPAGSIPGRDARPAKPGEFITIFCTGLGRVTPALATGVPATTNATVATPTVTIDGAKANVQFSGMAPGFVGLNQVNAQVPAGTRSGRDIPVVLTIGGKQSNTVTIAVSGS